MATYGNNPDRYDGSAAKNHYADTPRCGSLLRDGSGDTCKLPAGYQTDHYGRAACYLHGGNNDLGNRVSVHDRYKSITTPRIKEYLKHFEQVEDPTNLEPELALLRSLLVDFVNRYDLFTDALLSWNNSFTPRFAPAFRQYETERAFWQEKYEEWVQAYGESLEDLPPNCPVPSMPPAPPKPVDFSGKPTQVADVLSTAKYISSIGDLVTKINKSREEGTITLDTLRITLQRFGAELVSSLMEVLPDDDDLQSSILEATERRWASLTLPEPQRTWRGRVTDRTTTFDSPTNE